MLTQDQIAIQELLASEGWELFKGLLLMDKETGERNPRKCLRTQLNDKLMAAARAGEQLEANKYAAQIDIIRVILELPENEFKRKR